MAMHSVKTNALLNVIRQCCTIVFPLITIPYVSRVLGVDAYGQVNYCASIVAYITLVAGLGVSNYAIREGSRIRDDKKRFECFASQVFSINIVSTVIAYAVMAAMLVVWGGTDANRVIIVILSFNVLLTTLGTDWVNTVYEDFAYLTVRYIVCQGAAVALTLLLIHGPQDFTSMPSSRISVPSVLAFLISSTSIVSRALSYASLVRSTSFATGVQSCYCSAIWLPRLYINADTTMLGLMVGEIAVGYYAVASKICSIVKQLVNAISNVLVPRLPNSLASGSIEGFPRR